MDIADHDDQAKVPNTVVEPSDRSSALTQRKLELEIASLSRPWWRSPGNLAPIATISAAALGLVWALASGFFDVSRRELDLRKRELQLETEILQQHRDEQEARFRKDLAAQNKTLNELRGEAEHLRAEVSRLDRPTVTTIYTSLTAFAHAVDPQLVSLTILGQNLGNTQGTVTVVVNGACTYAHGNGESLIGGSHPLEAHVTQWSPHVIKLVVSPNQLRSTWLTMRRRALPASLKAVDVPLECSVSLVVSIQRADRKWSNQSSFSIPENALGSSS